MSGGKFNLSKGEYTDDTSMALCFGLSLIEKQSFNPTDQMDKYLKWFECEYMSSRDNAF